MCGIIGIIGKASVTPLPVEALKRLEYRKDDSAGVGTLVNGHIDARRAEGKLVNLERRLGAESRFGAIGVGYTDIEAVALLLTTRLERQLWSPDFLWSDWFHGWAARSDDGG